MQTNLLWRRSEYNSLENCLVDVTGDGSEIQSVIIGDDGGKIYKVAYRIKTNQNWETSFCEVKSQHTNRQEHFVFESNENRRWTKNGKVADEYEGCIDVDIALTPFTNTLAINRLKLALNEEQIIRVIYFDLLEFQIKPVRQKYRRLLDKEYHFENVPNDFEARITVDDSGFVTDYPSLFVLNTIMRSNYKRTE